MRKIWLLLVLLCAVACSPAPAKPSTDPRIEKLDSMIADIESRCEETGPEMTALKRRWDQTDESALARFRVYAMSLRTAEDKAVWKKWVQARKAAGKFEPNWFNFPDCWASYNTWRQSQRR